MAALWACLTSSFAPFIITISIPCQTISGYQKNVRKSKKIGKSKSRVIRNTVRSFGEIELTTFGNTMRGEATWIFCNECEQTEEELRILVVGLLEVAKPRKGRIVLLNDLSHCVSQLL